MRVKEDAEGVGCVVGGAVVGMSHHKPEDCEEGRGCEDIMGGFVLGDENNTEYTDEKGGDGEQGPLRTLIFICDSEDRHQEHTRCDEVPGLEHHEYRGGGGGIIIRYFYEWLLTGDDARYATGSGSGGAVFIIDECDGDCVCGEH